LTVAFLACLTAHASVITENNLTPVYSAMPPFTAANQITINWIAPTITITSVNYSNINSAAVQAAVKALPGTVVQGYFGNNVNNIQNITLPNSPTVDVFFVESITFCGTDMGGFDGCAFAIPNNSFAVDGGTAATANGTELEAHELGHDLGLVHCPDNCGGNPNLMDASGYGSTTLTAAQATILLGSPLLQKNGPANFINLQAITFAPEPASLQMLIFGMGLLLAARQFRAPATHTRK
jgi:hypothetical protein